MHRHARSAQIGRGNRRFARAVRAFRRAVCALPPHAWAATTTGELGGSYLNCALDTAHGCRALRGAAKDLRARMDSSSTYFKPPRGTKPISASARACAARLELARGALPHAFQFGASVNDFQMVGHVLGHEVAASSTPLAPDQFAAEPRLQLPSRGERRSPEQGSAPRVPPFDFAARRWLRQCALSKCLIQP